MTASTLARCRHGLAAEVCGFCLGTWQAQPPVGGSAFDWEPAAWPEARRPHRRRDDSSVPSSAEELRGDLDEEAEDDG